MVIDFAKENPLKTIIKNGKIPVIRVSDEGFKNYDQTSYYKGHEKEFHGETAPEGCFCHVGGIQARYVSGSHYDEKLNIGYVEPDTDIFCTYKATKNNIKGFAFNKASQKFKDVVEGYQADFKNEDGLVTSGSLEDFDLVSEAIINADKITTVAVIDPKDFNKFIPFINDDHLRMLCADLLFEYASDSKILPEEYLSHIGEVSYYEDKTKESDDHYGWGSNGIRRLSYFSDYREHCKTFENMALIEFVNFYKAQSFTYTKERIQALKDNLFAFNEFKKEKKRWYSFYTTYEIVYNNTSYLNVTFHLSTWRGNADGREEITFVLNENDFKVTEKLKNPEYTKELKAARYDKNKVKAPEYIYRVVKEDDFMKNTYRYFFYDFFIYYDKFYELLSDFFSISEPSCFKALKNMKRIEDTFRNKNRNYEYDDKYCVFNIHWGYFSLEYNMILKDGIVTIPHSEKIYYNIDNLPEDFGTIILMEDLSTLNGC